MALFCAAIWRESVSLLKFPFLSQVQVFPSEILAPALADSLSLKSERQKVSICVQKYSKYSG